MAALKSLNRAFSDSDETIQATHRENLPDACSEFRRVVASRAEDTGISHLIGPGNHSSFISE